MKKSTQKVTEIEEGEESQLKGLIHGKSIGEIRDKRDTPTHNKAIYCKPIASIKLNGEKLKAILLKSDCLLSISIQYST